MRDESYATYTIGQWLSSVDEGTYKHWRRVAQRECDTVDELALMLEEAYQDELNEAKDKLGTGWMTDLLQSEFNTIDWDEIAKDVWEDAWPDGKPSDDDEDDEEEETDE